MSHAAHRLEAEDGERWVFPLKIYSKRLSKLTVRANEFEILPSALKAE